jgi:hypothetical protein
MAPGGPTSQPPSFEFRALHSELFGLLPACRERPVRHQPRPGVPGHAEGDPEFYVPGGSDKLIWLIIEAFASDGGMKSGIGDGPKA